MGKISLPPGMIVVFLLVVVVGSVILYVVANKKWGYTEKRERELEEVTELQWEKRKRRKK